MPGRAIKIDEAIEKIGRFSKQDAIDLIESSHGVSSWNGRIGHPLQHCEIPTRAWPIGRFQNPETLAEEKTPSPERAAADLDKSTHTMSMTDLHLIQAVRDLFLGGGAFTALYHLKVKGVRSRLIYSKPTSHTTIPVTSTSEGPKGYRQHKCTTDDKLTRSYIAILDHCEGGRLQLQTIFAQPSNPSVTRIEVRGPSPDDKPFLMEFAT